MSPIADQPAPVPTAGPAIWPLVIDDLGRHIRGSSAEVVIVDMIERDRLGLARYGTRLQAHNGRDALVDAYQEALDMCVYLRQAIEEGTPDLQNIYDDQLRTAYRLRVRIGRRLG